VIVRSPPAVSLLVLLLMGPACSGSEPSDSATGAPVPSSPESVSPAPAGPRSAQAALARLCEYPPPQAPSGGAAEGPTPAAIAQVERQVQEIRGLRFTEPVSVSAASHAELVNGLERSFDSAYPAELYERRTSAWQAIGVIPPTTGVREALEEFAGSQVIGYYDTVSGELVFMGAEDPTALERVTLAHELTHAVDDQHFGLERIDRLANTCRDEAFQAAVGMVEGNATYFMLVYAQRYLTIEEQLEIGLQAPPSTEGIPEFILAMQSWPYTAGLLFVQALQARGGIEAVNRAFTHLPMSTEQIIHPERYPNDVPRPVDVPDLAPELGGGWTDLDVMGLGEAFLSIMLGLELDRTTADAAAAGWDGGIYRAWANGDRVAVVLSTVWDRPEDASEFAAAMTEYIGDRDGVSAMVTPVDGERVQVLFASDATTLDALRSAGY